MDIISEIVMGFMILGSLLVGYKLFMFILDDDFADNYFGDYLLATVVGACSAGLTWVILLGVVAFFLWAPIACSIALILGGAITLVVFTRKKKANAAEAASN